jgi:hypothetical protein
MIAASNNYVTEQAALRNEGDPNNIIDTFLAGSVA